MSAGNGLDTKAKDITGPMTVITVDSEATAKTVLETLSSNKIYSTPVWNASDAKCVGLVDLGDVVAYLVSLFKESAGVESYEELCKASTSDFDGGAIAERFWSTPVSMLVNFSGSNPYEPKSVDETTLADAVKVLARARRLVLVDEHCKVANVVSQSALVRYFATNLSALPAGVGAKTLAELNAVTKPLITVPSTVRAVDAFAVLAERHFSSVGIKTAKGPPATLGALTVKDVNLLLDNFAAIVLSVEDFMKIIRQKNLHTTYPTMGTPPTAALVDVVKKIHATKVHRLLVHPESGTAAADYNGLVSLGDIVRAVASHL
jgi:predicted transcriptional regulator